MSSGDRLTPTTSMPALNRLSMVVAPANELLPKTRIFEIERRMPAFLVICHLSSHPIYFDPSPVSFQIVDNCKPAKGKTFACDCEAAPMSCRGANHSFGFLVASPLYRRCYLAQGICLLPPLFTGYGIRAYTPKLLVIYHSCWSGEDGLVPCEYTERRHLADLCFYEYSSVSGS